MKVVQINAVYLYSSTGRNTMEMHQSLRSRGIESFVFCTNFYKPDENIFLIGNKIDYKMHALWSRICGLQGYFSCFSTKLLIRQLDKISPDVVVLGNLHANYINIEILLTYLSKKNIATVNVLHDCWSFTGHCCYYTEDGCYKWMTECNNCPILHKYNRSLFFDNSKKIFYKKKDLFGGISKLAVIGVSQWIANEGKRSPIFTNARIIKHIYNWINLDVFYPRETKTLREKLSLKIDDFVVLGVSQKWSEYKGLGHFISVANKINRIKFLMVGEMPDGVQLPSNIISIPPTNSADELAEYYSLGDVFLNFSIQETFGKVTAEALACGTPIIINNATANPELCGDGCGFVIDNNNEDDIIEAIRTIQKKGKHTYIDKCISFARSNFEKEKGISSYVELFNQLCGN